MRIFLLVNVIVAILFATSADQASAQSPNIPNFQDPKLRLTRPSKLVVNRLKFLTTTDFPPFNFVDRKKRLGGFHIDLARAICKELQLLRLCQIQALPWDQLENAVINGQGEAIIAGLAISKKSREKFVFSTVYLQIPARFIALKSANYREPMFSNIFKKKTGVIKGSAHAKYFQSVFGAREAIEFENFEAANTALKEKKIDLIFSDAISLSFWLVSANAKECCKLVGEPYVSQQYFGNGLAIALPKNKSELLPAVNYALAKVNESGKFRELYLRYFPISLY